MKFLAIALCLLCLAAPGRADPAGTAQSCPFAFSDIGSGAALGTRTFHVTLEDRGQDCRVEGIAKFEILTEAGSLDRTVRGNPSRFRIVARVAPGLPQARDVPNGYQGATRAELVWGMSLYCGKGEFVITFLDQTIRSPIENSRCDSEFRALLRPILDAMRSPTIIEVSEIDDDP